MKVNVYRNDKGELILIIASMDDHRCCWEFIGTFILVEA